MEALAPWTLTGRGFILLYRFPEEFVRESGFLPDEWKVMRWSGRGYVMLVDYQDSPVGPYHELLFIPGKTRIGGERLNTISKIYVDSLDSMNNGRNNWGIPKELADFSWSEEGCEQTIRVGGYDPFFEITIEPGSIHFPVHTRFMPIHLYQELDNKKFQVSPVGKGSGHFSLIKGLKVDPQFFPDLDLLEPSIVLYINPFTMTFPIAKTELINGD